MTLWRELRRLKDDYTKELQPYAEPANRADWAAFVLVMGGVNLPRSNRPVQLEYDTDNEGVINKETGEISFSAKSSQLKKLTGFRLSNTFIPIIKRIWSLTLSPPAIVCRLSPPREGEATYECVGGSRRWLNGIPYYRSKEPPSFGAFLGLV